ncbi:MAG: hypothetical protein HYV09_27315 [Deltaproteobacteria bacterium]|nr:hypothetical protein [Deltaproteobacteria bacterium]
MANPIEAFAATLNDEDRAVLHGSVAFVLRVVAKADSVVDKREQNAAAAANDLVRERFGAAFAGSDFPDANKAADHPDWPQLPWVRQLGGIVRRMPADARTIYDRALVELALSIAGASGGVLGFGEKLSAEERYAIRRVVSALDLQIADDAARKRLGY